MRGQDLCSHPGSGPNPSVAEASVTRTHSVHTHQEVFLYSQVKEKHPQRLSARMDPPAGTGVRWTDGWTDTTSAHLAQPVLFPGALQRPLQRPILTVLVKPSLYKTLQMPTNDCFQSPPTLFPAGLVGTLHSSQPGRSLLPWDQSILPAWETKSRTEGHGRHGHPKLGEKIPALQLPEWLRAEDERHPVGRSPKYMGQLQHCHPTCPRNQTWRFPCHQETGFLRAPKNPPQSQDRGSPAVPLQPERGQRHCWQHHPTS